MPWAKSALPNKQRKLAVLALQFALIWWATDSSAPLRVRFRQKYVCMKPGEAGRETKIDQSLSLKWGEPIDQSPVRFPGTCTHTAVVW